MLTVAKVTAGQADGYAEYLEAKTEPELLGDYYLKDGDRVQAPGRWASGATTVGCDPTAPVNGDVLRALMAVRRPDTGQPLRRVGSSGVAVAAIDATFSAPKSVSAVWALASPALRVRIEQAHEAAIDQALHYSLRHVSMVRERIDKHTVIHARAGSLIATSWRHTTARSVGGQPPDPQLHSHVLLHGAVRPDGMVVAIDSRAWLIHRRELGAAYRSELARGMAELGFGIRRGTGRAGRYFELSGVPPQLIDRWSARHHQVRAAIGARLAERRVMLEAVIAGQGEDSDGARRQLAELESAVQLAPKLDRQLTVATRAKKGPVRTGRELDQHWRAAGRQHRFDAGAIERLRTTPRTLEPASEAELLGRLTEFDARFAEREARAVALEASAGSPIEAALGRLAELQARGEMLALVDQSQTTRRHRLAEQDTVALARRLAAARVVPLAAALIEREARVLDRRLQGGLSREQRSALKLACSEHQLIVIQGHAGTGKSTTLQAAARAHRAAGQELVVVSTGALAAERLAGELEAAGAPARSYSLAALATALDTGALKLTGATTLIHDEAALASTREQQRLLRAVHESEARLIEVGDPRQSQPVGAGGLWPRIEQAARQQRSHVELTRNVRAQDPDDRRAQRLFRTGQAEDALHEYDARGRVCLEPDPRRVEDRALDAAQADRTTGKRTLVIAQSTNEHLDELNARAQAIRHHNGELGRQGVELPGRPYRLYAGDEVQVRRTVHDDQLGALRNGTTGVVAQAGRDTLALRLSDRREVMLSRGQVDAADLRLAYVQHPFPAQGATTDTTHLILAEHASQEGTYVALTRAREATHIYAAIDTHELDDGQDQLAALAEQISRSEPETPSIDFPLAHEAAIELEAARAADAGGPGVETEREVGERELKNERDIGFEM